MENPKLKVCQKLLKNCKQTPQPKKSKTRKLVRSHNKAQSHINVHELISGFEDLDESRTYYINLKENQLMNLFSAIRIKSISAKRRYKALMLKIFELQEKFKHNPVSRVVPSPRYLPNMSPITLSETHFFSSSFSSSFEAKSFLPSKADLLKRLDLVQYESCQTIESNCYIQERLKQVTEEKVSLIVRIGNLYSKKQVLAHEREKNWKFLQEIQEKAEESKKLENLLKMLKERVLNKQKKNSLLVESRLRIIDLADRVEKKRPVASALLKKLSELESENDLKETYLKSLLSLKSQILSRTGEKK